MSDQTVNPIEQSNTALSAPVAPKVPHTTAIHNEELIDNYSWMRNSEDPLLLPHLQAENAFHDAYMADTQALQDTLYREMRSRIKETDSSVPYKRGKWLYYSRTEEGKQYPKHCRKLDRRGSIEQVYLDVAELAAGLNFFQIGDLTISPSGNFLAYTVDTLGFRRYRLVVKNLRTGEILSDTAERVTSVVWAKDNKTLFYTTEDETTKRSDLLFRHRVGQQEHVRIFEEKDELYRLYLAKTRVGEFVYLYSASHETAEVSTIPADKPLSSFTVILPRKDKVRHSVLEDGKGYFYIATNDGAKNFKLVKTPVAKTSPENWHEIVGNRDHVLLTDLDVFDKHLVVYEKEGGLARIRVQDLESGYIHRVKFTEPAYSVEAGNNAEFKTKTLRLHYSSLVSPASTIAYDLESQKREVLKVVEVPGFDSSLYKSERIFATAPDGTQIPISLVYKKELKLDGGRHLHLYGYGSYGHAIDPSFGSNRFSLIDRGMIYAIAHIRGGNDLGEHWHDQGKLMEKMNTFTDFIACAQHLIAQKYTTKITIEGGSAGGLLMGAVANLRPDLFHAVVSSVPFVDVINTMLDKTLPLTVGEYIEWGNPENEAAFRYIRTYSPYENIERKNYPAMLVRTALHDSQVGYWEPAKWVAKLRELKTDNNPLLLHVELKEGGHGGASGRFDYLREVASVQAFILKQLGIKE
jgi:oligopeptidase B